MRVINGVLAAAVAVILTTGAGAQVQTSKTVEHGAPSATTTVERGEVVHVSGNELMVKMEDGTLRDFQNVSESARVIVDGKELTIHDLKPGMKLQRTITTTTTPRIVTTVQTVTGKVFHVIPPSSVILTLEDGTNQQFTIPKDQKFNIDGQMVDAFHLKKGMTVSATKVVEAPETVVAHQRSVTGSMPPPPAPPAADAPIIVMMLPAARPAAKPAPVESASAAPAPDSAPASAPKELPKTGSDLPLIGLLGAFSLALAGGMRFLRRQA